MSGLLRRLLPRAATALVLCAMLGGCAQLPSIKGAAPWRPARRAITAYILSGRISVRRSDQAYVADIVWRHDVASDDIMLSTMLGQGVAQLTRNAAGAHLKTEHHEYDAPNLAALSKRVFGVALPLGALPRWVIADAPIGAALDAQGRPLSFTAAGWRVRYLEYEDNAAYALPQLVELERGDIDLRMKIDEWQKVR